MNTLGQRIAAYRKQANLTQEELARQLNVSAQAVSKWENDISIPDLTLIIELSNLFSISVDQLVKEQSTLPTTYYVPVETRKKINQMVLRITIDSKGDIVKVNLPLVVIKACLDANMPVVGEINGKKTSDVIDFNYIFQLIEQGVIGTLVEIDTNDGDHIIVSVE